MSIELPSSVEEQLRNLAQSKAATCARSSKKRSGSTSNPPPSRDLEPTQVAEAQAALLGDYRIFPTGRPTMRKASGDLVG
jgi:hypothetical protein